jgi:hypothetical protein
MKDKIIQKLTRTYFACDICSTEKVQDRYKYKPLQYVPDHIPPTTENTCRKCLYREEYGSKTFRKKMKENTLG